MNGEKCYKLFLVCSNIGLLFVGLAVLILGVKMKWALSLFLIIDIPVILKAVDAVIATGTFISLSGATGLSGALSENKSLILGYLVSLGIIVVMEFSVSVTLMIVRKTVSAALETPDCNGVCSASIDAAILDYALPSAGLMMTVIFVEALMIYSSIKMYFYLRDTSKVASSPPPSVIQGVQMRNVTNSLSTYVGTPQQTNTSHFEYSPHHIQTIYGHRLESQAAGYEAAAEEKPPDYNSLTLRPPLYTDRSPSVGDSMFENTNPKDRDEVFHEV